MKDTNGNVRNDHTFQFFILTLLQNTDDLQVRFGELEGDLLTCQLLVDSRESIGLEETIVWNLVSMKEF